MAVTLKLKCVFEPGQSWRARAEVRFEDSSDRDYFEVVSQRCEAETMPMSVQRVGCANKKGLRFLASP
jgi:hypothetical protein